MSNGSDFGFVLGFSALWMLICYAPVAHWIWGGGMLADGGIFGEIGAKISQAASWCMKPQASPRFAGRDDRPTPPQNHPAAQSRHGADRCGHALGRLVRVQRRLAAWPPMAAPRWRSPSLISPPLPPRCLGPLWERIKFGKSSLVGLVTGTIAGLASITPASGFVGPLKRLPSA